MLFSRVTSYGPFVLPRVLCWPLRLPVRLVGQIDSFLQNQLSALSGLLPFWYFFSFCFYLLFPSLCWVWAILLSPRVEQEPLCRQKPAGCDLSPGAGAAPEAWLSTGAQFSSLPHFRDFVFDPWRIQQRVSSFPGLWGVFWGSCVVVWLCSRICGLGLDDDVRPLKLETPFVSSMFLSRFLSIIFLS